MKNPRALKVLIGICGLCILAAVPFQNCAMTGFTPLNVASLELQSVKGTDGTTDVVPTPVPNMPSPNPSPNPGASPGNMQTATPTASPTATPAAGACILDSATSGSVMGITGQAPIRSGVAFLSRTDTEYVKMTSIALSFNSDCFQKSQLTTPQKCSSNTICQKRESFTITISLTCSNTSADASECSSFTNGQVVDLASANATLVSKISISSQVSSDICNTAATTTYMLPFLNKKAGTIVFNTLDELKDGRKFSLMLSGVKLEKGGNNAQDFITLDGTYAAEIVTVPECQK